MPRGTCSKKIGKDCERNLDAGLFQPMIGSFDLYLRAETKPPKTACTYLKGALWFAVELRACRIGPT